jgi:hypothetical protein
VVKFQDLEGKSLSKIDVLGRPRDKIIFHTNSGERYLMYHPQLCCEYVSIEDICGDLNDVIGSPVLLAEEVQSNKNPESITKEYQDSFTWTFYKISTIKGSVTIR